MNKHHAIFLLATLGCVAAAPAQDFFARKPPATAASAANETPRENARADLLLQQVERLAGQVDALRQDYAQLEQRVTQAEQQQRAVTTLQNENAKLRDETKTLRDETKALRDELAQVKADRETLRKQITDDLSVRITAAIEKSNAKPAPQGNAPKNTRADGKETGREHIVEAGQTLSEIATAYKTQRDVLIKANNIKNPDSLRIGQKIFIPDP